MYVTVNGVQLFFDVDGEGLTPDGPRMRQKPTVVMVHGGPGADHSIAKPFFSQLTDIAQVVYYDHRGNGRSEAGDPASWTLAQWGDDLHGLCGALGIVRPIVIGTSFGGFVSLSYATRHPGHAAGLVLISTAAHVDFEQVYQAFERLGGAEIAAIARAYWQAPTAEGRALYRTHCLPLYQRRAGTPDWLHRILCTTLRRFGSTGRGTNTGAWISAPTCTGSRVRWQSFRAPRIRSPRPHSAMASPPG